MISLPSEAGMPFELGAMPLGRPMQTIDEQVVRAPEETMFTLAREVERWPDHLLHYRGVRFLERSHDGGGIVEMAAWRPFGPLRWPTRWMSEMTVDEKARSIRYRHVRGITTGMDVEWTLEAVPGGTRVRIVHAWNGPRWPMIGIAAAVYVIGPVFIHGIASRTLAGLAAEAERRTQPGLVEDVRAG